MRRVIVTEFVSLDGVTEEPQKWSEAFARVKGQKILPESLRYWNDEIAKFMHEELFAVDALLLGRVTYQGFAAAWPSRTGEEGYADRMNNLPKYVVSRTLEEVKWNNSRLVKGDVVEEVSRLKQQPGQDILIFGSGQLVDSLAQHDLVDEYRLLVYPVVLGSGKRLFKEGSNKNLKLAETKTFSSGVVLLRYYPDRK